MSNLIRTILIVLVAIAVALLTGVLIGEASYFRLAMVLLFVAFLFFLQYPELPAFLVVTLYYSGLTTPKMPGKLNFFYLTAACLVGIMVFQFLLNRARRISWARAHSFMAAFGVVLILTMAVRGAGFRVLGTETWGGMFYVQLFIGMFLVLALPMAGLKSKWWVVAIVCMGLSSILPLIADLLILKGFDPEFVWSFVQGSGQIGLSMSAQTHAGKGVIRLFSAGTTGQVLLISFLSMVGMKKVLSLRGLWLLPWPIGFFALTLLGGFRLGVLDFLMIGALVGYFQRAFTIVRVYFLCALMLAGWFALIHTAPYLPSSAQRAVSWVPGTDIPAYVQEDAEGTVAWRLELWSEAMKLLPQYWLVGKGYAFHAKEIVAVSGANQRTDALGWAMVTSAYHNGPISLLLGLGIFGLITGLGLLFSICLRHRRLMKESWFNSRLQRCHQAVFAMFLTYVLIFLTIYGDVQVSFPLMLFLFALLEGLKSADLDEADRAETGRRPA